MRPLKQNNTGVNTTQVLCLKTTTLWKIFLREKGSYKIQYDTSICGLQTVLGSVTFVTCYIVTLMPVTSNSLVTVLLIENENLLSTVLSFLANVAYIQVTCRWSRSQAARYLNWPGFNTGKTTINEAYRHMKALTLVALLGRICLWYQSDEDTYGLDNEYFIRYIQYIYIWFHMLIF